MSLEDISELKKELKRLINKRSIFVATRLSGANQDNELKTCDVNTNKLDAEIAVVKAMKSRGERTVPADKYRSEFITLHAHQAPHSPDSVIAKLESVRTQIKDQVSVRCSSIFTHSHDVM